MYSSYSRGYADGYLAAKAEMSQPQKIVATIKWEAIISKAEEIDRQKRVGDYYPTEWSREHASDSQYDDWDDAFDSSDDDEYDPRPSSKEPKPDNYTRNPYDESDSDSDSDYWVVTPSRWGMMHNLPIKEDKIYRTFEASDFKNAKDMVPHISEVSQWSSVVTMDDFDTSIYEWTDGGYRELALKYNKERLDEEVQKICLDAKEKGNTKNFPSVGTHEERKKTKKQLREKKMAKKKAIRSSKKNNRRSAPPCDY